MIVNGWMLFVHPLFSSLYENLVKEADKIMSKRPLDYKNHPKVKLLAKVTELILEDIPNDPSHDKFNQGSTLGTMNRCWKRAKFGRYRLFFRFQSGAEQKRTPEKVIVYAWLNDENTIRKDGDKNDVYAVFERKLRSGKPPASIEDLVVESKQLKLTTKLERLKGR
jgi:toxin YhaV